MFNFFQKKPPPAGGQILSLKLSGLHCTSCAVNIDLTLEDLPGVVSSKTNYARSTATVEFEPEKTTAPAIIAEINKLGYTVKN